VTQITASGHERGQIVNAAYLSALAALAGSVIGGLTSFLSTWLSRNAQVKADLFLRDKDHRQALYRAFIEEASELYIDALTNDKPDLSKTIALYVLISRMRVISSPNVIEEADKMARLIVECYPQQNKTFNDLRRMIDDNALDPLRAFSEFCREELGMLVLR
jgi:hypothetical protein